MTAETFFANFGHLADAPNGVQKLRELILQLAVQGKLVQQDPNDEPASVLLERIEAEKRKLIATKEIRPKKITVFDNVPYPLPKNWSWVPIGNICRDWGQKVPDKKFSYIEVSAIDNEKGVVTEPAVTTVANAPSRAIKLVQPGTVIYSTVRPYLLNIAVIGKVFEPEPIASTAFAIVHPLGGISSQYIFWFLRSPFFVAYVESKMLGVAYPAINDSQFFSGLFPLPPLEEQKRIVAKVDQLMAQCNELEASQQKQQQGRVRLNNTALDALLTASNPNEFADHWERISTNFDLLYDHPETIAKLRAAILQLAVQGKLVPQDPNDEPASVLLERIKADRQSMISEGVLKRFKPLSVLERKNHPFITPSGWEFERMGNLFQFIDYRGKTPEKVSSGVKLITAKNVRMGYLKEEPQGFVTEKTYHEWMTRGFPQIGDLLFTTEAPMGNVCLVENDEPFALAQRTINLHPFGKQNSLYIMFAIMSGTVQSLISELATGMTATGIKAAKLKLVPIPLPLLEEQKRIVAKVDQLMALCDELEAKLNQAQQNSEKLMEAAVREFLVADLTRNEQGQAKLTS